MQAELSPLGRLALDAALNGAEVVTAATGKTLLVRTKTSHRDLVTHVDAAAEAAVTMHIRRHRPSDAILGEETGDHAGTGAVRWMIDPIDGTANFVRGRPDYAVAVAAEINGRVAVGAIVKPATGEWIAADERGTIECSGGPVQIAPRRPLRESLVSVSVSIDEARRPVTLGTLTRLLPEVQDFRRSGSTSCDLFAIAVGQLDAYVGVGSNAWDIAPGWAVISAARGSCLRFPVAGGHEAFVLGVPSITGEIADVVKECAQSATAARAFPRHGPQPGAAPHRPGDGRGVPPPQLPRTERGR